MMRTNSSKRSVPTNRLPDWDSGVDYVETNAREKSKQILLNHCRKKYSFPCLGASNFDQERQKSGFQRTCNAHIGPNDIENSSSSDWRRPCIGCLSELVGNMAVYNAAPHFRGSSSIWGASAGWAAKMASQLPNLHSPPKNDP